MSPSTPRSSHFFKIILQEHVKASKIAIPKKFLSNYRKCLPEKVVLKIATGDTWLIELEKCGEEVWLQKGWQEFAAHYSLNHGHLVMFGYGGNATFHVLIFDKSATEIDYPLNPQRHDGGRSSSKKGGDTFVENTEGNSGCDKTTEQPQCDLPHKRTRANETGIHASSSAPKTCTPSKSEFMNSQSRKNKLHDNFKRNTEFQNSAEGTKAKRSRVNRPMPQNSEAALNGTKFSGKRTDNESNNPFFTVKMCPSYMDRSLALPNEFFKKYLQRKKGTAILQVGHKSWPVNLSIASNGRGWFYGGWPTFVKENAIETEDVCVFEMTDSSENVLLEVTILRSSSNPVEESDTY